MLIDVEVDSERCVIVYLVGSWSLIHRASHESARSLSGARGTYVGGPLRDVTVARKLTVNAPLGSPTAFEQDTDSDTASMDINTVVGTGTPQRKR